MRDADYERIARDMANQDYDDWICGDRKANVDDWMESNAHEYIQHLMRGGEYGLAARVNMRRDCVYTLADDMDDRVREYMRDMANEYAEE